MSDRYFADLDIHGEVIRFYPDDGKTRLHQNDARRIPVESVAFVRERAIADAVTAERERFLRIVMREGITPAIPDDPDPVAEAINGALQNIHEAIRSAAK